MVAARRHDSEDELAGNRARDVSGVDASEVCAVVTSGYASGNGVMRPITVDPVLVRGQQARCVNAGEGVGDLAGVGDLCARKNAT
jgi:hypothetical protein